MKRKEVESEFEFDESEIEFDDIFIEIPCDNLPKKLKTKVEDEVDEVDEDPNDNEEFDEEPNENNEGSDEDPNEDNENNEDNDDPNDNDDIVYHGQVKCFKQVDGCSNKAYWKVGNKYLCGTHSKKSVRKALPKLSKKEIDERKKSKDAKDYKLAKQMAEKNKKAGKKGKVILQKMKMRRALPTEPGFLKVFPNNLHQNRKDGFGCASLSPMQLGPVKHGQPGLPDCFNIENFHQGSKCFKEELNTDGNPSKLFYKNRRTWYNDVKPHRHKYLGEDKKKKNIPRYFVWVDKDKKEHHLDYIASRQFYCNFYERLAKKQKDFEKLKKMIDDGWNLQICGYDARPIEMNAKAVENAYKDDSSPFGHEIVLFSMLVLKEESWPWRKYKTFEF
jgi:hypothetical protein